MNLSTNFVIQTVDLDDGVNHNEPLKLYETNNECFKCDQMYCKIELRTMNRESGYYLFNYTDDKCT